MPEPPIMKLASRMAFACARGLRDIARGAAGLDAYEQYLRHTRARHPGVRPMTREAFFRADLAARWNGIRRCC